MFIFRFSILVAELQLSKCHKAATPISILRNAHRLVRISFRIKRIYMEKASRR